MNEIDSWPAGRTWVFEGTVAEDSSGGTHICSLTVTPGAGNELELLYGEIIDGNTATSQQLAVTIDDGTNELLLVNAITSTTAVLRLQFPTPIAAANNNPPSTGKFLVSGAMRLMLKVTTTQISVTQTFAVVCRIKGAVPTATLADTVGTPVLTTNTSAVF